MILAQQPAETTGLWIGAGVILVLGIALLFGLRGYQAWAQRSLEACYEGLELHATFEPGTVVIEYHTYHGVIAWFTQTPHRAILSAEEARKLLSRLFWFNLTWSWLTPGVVFIIPLAILNYFAQQRSIAQQELRSPPDGSDPSVVARTEHTPPACGDNPYASPLTQQLPAAEPAAKGSTFYVVFGWLIAAVAVMMLVGSVVAAFKEGWTMIVFGLIVAAVIGSLAKSWLAKGYGFEE